MRNYEAKSGKHCFVRERSPIGLQGTKEDKNVSDSLSLFTPLLPTHHLNGGGEAGTDAAAAIGAVESTGAGPRAGAAGASFEGASMETLFFCCSAGAEGEEILTARGSAALRGATGRADAMPEGVRRATRACIVGTRGKRGGGGEAREEKKTMDCGVRKSLKNPRPPSSTSTSMKRHHPLFPPFVLPA